MPFQGDLENSKWISTAAMLLAAASAGAHHSRSIYDEAQTLTFEGVVTEFEWANPHVYLYVEVPGEAGEPVVWTIEHGSTTAMKKRGWSPDTFVPGETVIVQAHPERNSTRNMALVYSVEKAGVTRLGRGDPDEPLDAIQGPAAEADGLSGTWVILQTLMVRYFSEPYDWPLTEAGAAAVASYDDLTMNPQIRCQSRTAPWFMIFPSVQRIDVGETAVTIHSEYDAIERTIHLDVDSHDGAVASHHGHSIGWWEGDVLVVDTTHFSDHRSGAARGIPSGSQKHLVERFALDPDRTSMTYSFELTDPEFLSETVTGGVQSAYRPDVEFAPIPCDPENARRFIQESE
ncbi:MAG TPA: DUF6152 family protein [Gammaproteobacteria bacterium]